MCMVVVCGWVGGEREDAFWFRRIWMNRVASGCANGWRPRLLCITDKAARGRSANHVRTAFIGKHCRFRGVGAVES